MGRKSNKVVIFGGGTGLSIILRGLKLFTDDITAIVTVADDGGGSGVLRSDLGMLPPGDIRNCIISLADTPPVMERLMQHRFQEGQLKGQSFGNLLIAAMNEMYGDFDYAIKEISNIFRIRGRVLPMTLEDIHLHGELENGSVICGENKIPLMAKQTKQKIHRVFLSPETCEPLEETIQSILEADIIVLGPGSLYTSVIPNLLVKDIPYWIKQSKAEVYYICNIMTQPGETDGYDVKDHVKALWDHAPDLPIHYILANNQIIPDTVSEIYKQEKSEMVKLDSLQESFLNKKNIKIISDNFLDIEQNYIRHDAVQLSKTILQDNRIIRFKAR